MQLDFYLNDDDKMECVDFLFSKGAKLVPSIHYPSKEYFELSTLNQYQNYVGQNSLMHIIHPSFTQLELEFDFFEKEGKRVFYILQRYGGPTIDFYSPGKINRDGTCFIGCGFISIYQYYWKGREKIMASNELKLFYKDLSKFIKDRSTLIKYSKRSYYVGLNAMQATLHGCRLVDISKEIISGMTD